jgi:16S rRNA (uracil1498-N3)-methyltransferase
MPRDDWKKLPRLFCATPLGDSATITLDDAQHHYLTNVMRRPTGSQILLFNGQDGEWLATLIAAGKKSSTAQCQQQTRPQTIEPALCLLFAPIKRDHLDYMVQKASELGVTHLQPIITQHTITTQFNHTRLETIAREAAEQCERLTLPILGEILPLAAAMQTCAADRPLLACLEGGSAQPLATALTVKPMPSAVILVGPEGGFSADEMAMIRQHPTVLPVSLGPRILRADTAALAAITLWQALQGDWR